MLRRDWWHLAFSAVCPISWSGAAGVALHVGGEEIMEQPGLHGRHRNKDGQISHKHGNTLVSTLRKIYGPSFAEGADPHETLAEVLEETHEHSLSQLQRDQLHRDHDNGHLEAKIVEHESS